MQVPWVTSLRGVGDRSWLSARSSHHTRGTSVSSTSGAWATTITAVSRSSTHGKGRRSRRFLVVCALVSDLSCPGYNPRQSPGKNSNLARTAVRYKVDSAKTATAVGVELSRPKSKVNEETQPESRKTSNSRKPKPVK